MSHVIDIVFDNVHFARDNPNVPSDLEQMPHLLSFLEQNGTVFSNSHTPIIANTADDSLTIYTGLYGDRFGQTSPSASAVADKLRPSRADTTATTACSARVMLHRTRGRHTEPDPQRLRGHERRTQPR